LDRAESQEIRAVGGLLGRVSSEQTWTPSAETGPRSGWGLGAFVEVALPASFLSVVAEGLVVQRGTALYVDTESHMEQTQVESDYLAFPLLLKLRYFHEPFGAYALAGPAVEYLLQTRADPGLGQVYRHEEGVVGSVVVGAGVEGLISTRVAVMLEARLNQGLTDAYSGDVAQVRRRTLEVLFRVGVRPETATPPR